MIKLFTLHTKKSFISKSILAVLFVTLSIVLLGLGVWGDMHGYPTQRSYRFAFAVASILIQFVLLFIPKRIGLQVLVGVLGLIWMSTIPGRLAEYRYKELERFRINNTVVYEMADEPLYTNKGTAIGVIIKFRAKLPMKWDDALYPGLILKTSGFYATPNDILVADVIGDYTSFSIVKRAVEPKTTDYQNLNEQLGLSVPDLIPDIRQPIFMNRGPVPRQRHRSSVPYVSPHR